jgi:hypothetical protein
MDTYILSQMNSLSYDTVSRHDLDMYILLPTGGTSFQYDTVNRLTVQIYTYFHLKKALMFSMILSIV